MGFGDRINARDQQRDGTASALARREAELRESLQEYLNSIGAEIASVCESRGKQPVNTGRQKGRRFIVDHAAWILDGDTGLGLDASSHCFRFYKPNHYREPFAKRTPRRFQRATGSVFGGHWVPDRTFLDVLEAVHLRVPTGRLSIYCDTVSKADGMSGRSFYWDGSSLSTDGSAGSRDEISFEDWLVSVF